MPKINVVTAIGAVLLASLALSTPSHAKAGAKPKLSGSAKDLSVPNDYQPHAKIPHSLRKEAAKRLRNAQYKAREQHNRDAKELKRRGGRK